jgi:hypothetical protein
MSKEMKKFQCNILDYVEKKHPDVFKAITELCLKGAFKPRRETGVTFIIPAPDTIKEIMPGIYSDKEAEYEKAWSTMQAHILNDCYESPAEFKDDEVVNRLSQKLEFDSVSGNKAILKNKTELTLDTGFKMIPGRKGLSIYTANGPIPTNGPAATEKPRKPKAEGSKRAAVGRAEFNRVEFVKRIESEFVEKKDGGACYLKAVLSLMAHLEKNKESSDYKKAVVSLDMSPFTSLYILLEPHHSGKMLLSDEVLSSWDMKLDNVQGEAAVSAYIKHLSEGEHLLGKDLDDKIDSARWKIISGGISRHNLPNAIGGQYRSLTKELYSDGELKEFFTPEYKEWQDLARYHINYMFTYFETLIGNHKHEFDEVKSCIESILSGDERFSTKTWSPLTSKDDFLAGPIAFVQSGSFLYYPGEKKHTKGADDDDDDMPAAVGRMSEFGTGQKSALEASAGCCQ